MKRYYITKGATTTAGGVVLAGSSRQTINGIPIAREGDPVACHACDTTGYIQCVEPRHPFTITDAPGDARRPALEGDLCICECTPHPTLIANQFHTCQQIKGG